MSQKRKRGSNSAQTDNEINMPHTLMIAGKGDLVIPQQSLLMAYPNEDDFESKLTIVSSVEDLESLYEHVGGERNKVPLYKLLSWIRCIGINVATMSSLPRMLDQARSTSFSVGHQGPHAMRNYWYQLSTRVGHVVGICIYHANVKSFTAALGGAPAITTEDFVRIPFVFTVPENAATSCTGVDSSLPESWYGLIDFINSQSLFQGKVQSYTTAFAVKQLSIALALSKTKPADADLQTAKKGMVWMPKESFYQIILVGDVQFGSIGIGEDGIFVDVMPSAGAMLQKVPLQPIRVGLGLKEAVIKRK